MLPQLVLHPGLQAFEDFRVGPFRLTVALWMSNVDAP